MRRKLLIAALALGTVVGYGSGFRHLRHGCPHGHGAPPPVPPACAPSGADAPPSP